MPRATVTAFLSGFSRRQALRTIELPGGFAALDDAYPLSYADNQVFIDGPTDPAGLPGLVDRALAPLPHRMVTVLDEDMGEACAPYLTAAGYVHNIYVVMLHEAPVPPAAPTAAPAPLSDFRTALARRWRGFVPDAGEEVIRQLVDRRENRRRGADVVHFVTARTAAGEPAAWADVYADPAAGVAQIEDLVTAEEHLGRGHGTAVLHSALHLAADCPTRFLIADSDDWPRHWYARQGFTVIGRMHHFERV
ncbi:GNAT family N-acetyltransferase [Streptomyces bambusae]|uniref:GNAT family N-acetyltransferase n=1 Tax=Streptomyces bambusae TaxID=1550616 RepID=A0ABS6Z907_9ACTN|nr:GNAT family N-acetyltransferase [Streptomyces bambusae]MBW5484258.1 GNAT family N-acetyltransferase [Streptomyces bambusae]